MTSDAASGPSAEAPGSSRFLTPSDVAEVLSISATDVLALVRSGELPAIRVGDAGHWRVERDVLEGYIAGKYEENRRRNLWNQTEYSDVPELFL